jgi:hypothetical protein
LYSKPRDQASNQFRFRISLNSNQIQNSDLFLNFNSKPMAIQGELSTSKLLQITYSTFWQNFIFFDASSYFCGFIPYTALLENLILKSEILFSCIAELGLLTQPIACLPKTHIAAAPHRQSPLSLAGPTRQGKNSPIPRARALFWPAPRQGPLVGPPRDTPPLPTARAAI